ncbi:MAG: xylulokinase [Anaerolineae bacterium]
MPYLLGIDAGTTSIKAGVFSPDGRCAGIGRQEYQLDSPAPDRAQLDPEIYWHACVEAVRGALAAAHIQAPEIAAIGISSQGETTITLDKDGTPIYPALVWLDNRAMEQASALSREFGAQVYSRTGIPEIIPTWPACKIAWIRDNEPQVFRRAAKYLLVQDYLVFRLTGRIVTDSSVSSTTLNYDIIRHRWWTDLLDAVGITPEQLPEVMTPGTRVGSLTGEAANLLGLSMDTAVVLGGMDQSVGAIGAGNYKSGTVSETTGAALTVQATISNPLVDKSGTVPVYAHSVPGLYLFCPVVPTAGMALKWLRDTFFEEEIEKAKADRTDPYDRLTQLAAAVPPGADGLIMLPHLMGAFSPTPNPKARGSFTGFSLAHTRGHFVRALLESVAFLLRQNLEAIERTGLPVREIRSTGGGARSALWLQIKADVCNQPIVTLVNEDTALLGDAVLAGVASGLFSSIEQGAEAMVRISTITWPDEQAAAYTDIYRRYCELDAQLADYFRKNYPGTSQA